ncbi:MAG: hypothetical protein JST22_01040 [Bacteroidetes bacterium]|nr:hypothetical protein [Bacteroidota bacterium]
MDVTDLPPSHRELRTAESMRLDGNVRSCSHRGHNPFMRLLRNHYSPRCSFMEMRWEGRGATASIAGRLTVERRKGTVGLQMENVPAEVRKAVVG